MNVPGTLGASFEHVETVPANQVDPKGAYQSSGIRPAFYLNESMFSGEVFKEKPSDKKTILNAAVELSQESYIYDGLAKKPSVSVYLNGKTLTQNVDYTVTYSNNINIGIATVTITGIGNYTGIIIKKFTIEEMETSGSCGDNLTWVISGNKQLTLTISGTGTMTNYSSSKEVPWNDRASSITSLIIENGVGTIGDNAFAGFAAIENVEIPESVKAIGYGAFTNMDKIEGIVITDGVTSIGDRAFYSCDKLSYVEIAGSVTSVGSSAFNACDSLKEVIFCGDAPKIGTDCFSNTPDLSIYYTETATGWNFNIQQPYDLCKWQKWDNTVPTRDIVLLLDVSGSMQNKTAKLKAAVNSFIGAMGGRLKNTRVALVPYNSSASVLSKLTTNKGYLATLVNGLTADGGTSYLKALNSVDALLASSNAKQKAIVMFSDGEPEDSNKNDIYSLSEKLRESYIIYTVGLVDSSSYSDVLKKVAGSDGRYFEADNINGLIDAFLNVADEMDSTIKDFSIDQTAKGSVNGLVRISGSISLTEDSKFSEAVLEAKIKSILWTSSNQDIVQDSEIVCLGVNSYDNRSAELMISFTPHKKGKVTITGTTSNSLTKSCLVTVSSTDEILPKNPVHHCTLKNDGTDITDWSYIYFGNYPQTEVKDEALTKDIIDAEYDTDGDASVDGLRYRRISKSDTNSDAYFGDSQYRYFKWEPIKWRVMNNDGSELFIMADMGLDCKDYNEKYVSITWEDCTLREWMNKKFYMTAFDSNERDAIITKDVVNEDNPLYGTEGGNDTKDNIYLLSIGEATNPEYGFCEDYSIHSVSRRLQPSDYASAMGSMAENEGNIHWWLRKLGNNKLNIENIAEYEAFNAMYIDEYGCIGTDGRCVDHEEMAVQLSVVPILHVDYSSDCWSLADDENDINEPNEKIVSLLYRSDGTFGEKYEGSKSVNARHNFYYSDAFFYSDSSKYNNTLAVMSLGLELTAFSSPQYDAYHTDTLEKEMRAANIVDAYDKLGFDNAQYYNYEVPLSDHEDKVAFSFATKKITDGKSDDTLLAVVIRGGGYGAEWASNFHVGNSGNAEGFDKSAKDVLEELKKYVKSNGEEIQGDLKLWIVGFSRGGAVANILTHYINKDRSSVYDSLTPNNIYAYTFATPSGYRENDSDQNHDWNLWNVVAANDIVPKVALKKWGFSKYGKTKVLPEYSTKMLKYRYYQLTGKDFELKYANRAEEAITDVLYDVTGGTTIWSLEFENTVMIGMRAWQSKLFFDQTRGIAELLKIIDNIIETKTGKLKLLYVVSCIVGEEVSYLFDTVGTVQGDMCLWDVMKIMFDAHYPEYYLSWLEGALLNDTYARLSQEERDEIDNTVMGLFEKTYLKYSFFCPVDVNVYSSDGSLVASIINNQVVTEGLPCYVDGDEKVVYLIDNDTYRLELIGNDTGKMDYTVDEFNADSEVVRSVYYYDVPLEKGLKYTDTVNNVILNTQEDYSITDGKNETIPALDTLTGSTTEYKITVENGASLKSSAVQGESVSIIPIVEEGYEFVKWTSSEETDIFSDMMAESTRFCMPGNDVVITAILKKVDSSENDNNIGDILPEDIPTDGKIPDGLWIAGIQTYTYTRKPVKPEVRVYDSNKLLKAGQDYTISYKNNTKANDASNESTAPAVVVKGKGNYTGTEKQTFKILPLDLNDTSIVADDITVAYNKKEQKKVPVVTYNGKKLAKNKDFTVSYPSQGIDAYKSAGTYEILLTAKQNGNFTGTRTVQFTITNNTLISSATVKKIANQAYTGKAIEPTLEVTMKKAPLVKNTDYTVTYANNIESGTATAILTGIGKYAGTKKVTFKINGTPLKGAVVSGITDKVYNGTAQEQKITVTLNNKTLTAGIDYKVVYSQNINAGTATVTIKGIKAYSGTVKKTFKITAYDMKENAGSQIGGLGKEITVKYLKGGSKPKLELTFAGKKLIEGTDYTVSCQNNKTVTTANTKSKPTMTIKGKGNFKGSLTKTFTITGKALNDTEAPVTLNVADKGFVDKAGKYISVPVLIDTDGKKLAAGKDYESTVVYSLEDGTELTKNSKVNAGTKVKVRVTGKGAYTGDLVGVYQITQNDFNKAKISINPQIYTGKAVTLNKDSVTVKIGKDTLTFGTDYEIVENSYTNNINKGTASVTIVGKGNYGGTKTVKFKITARKLSWFWRLFG